MFVEVPWGSMGIVLVFYVGDNRYGLDASQVVEIIPRVALRRMDRAAAHWAGTFYYRGSLVPVVDLCQLVCDRPAGERLSTRIAIADYPDEAGRSRRLGLMAEQMTETLNRLDARSVDDGGRMGHLPYFAEMLVDDRGPVQCLRPSVLLGEMMPTAAAHAPGTGGGVR